MGTLRIGVAGWSVPAAPEFDEVGSHLERYARRFDAVEINSSFHRSHRATTYARWAASVGPDFRFAVKLPKAITHVHRLQDCAELLARFASEVEGLGDKRGPTLVQLPPSLAFDEAVASAFFDNLRARLLGDIVCEPRHATWFDPAAEALLQRSMIARVAADPGRVPAALDPGGWRKLAYFRLHGAPQIYRSPYSAEAIEQHATRLRALDQAGTTTWTIYDNTASGSAIVNALDLAGHLSSGRSGAA